MRIIAQFLDPQTNKLAPVKNLAALYGLKVSTVHYRARHNIPFTDPPGSGGSSKALKESWAKRKQEMADVIAGMAKRK